MSASKGVRTAACWLLLALQALCLAPAGAGEVATEQSMRAALVFNFIKFTEWPAAATQNAQLRLCIASNDQTQIAALEALDARSVRGMPLVAVRFRRQADCNVIYVDARQRWLELAEKLAGVPVLTIGSYPGFVTDGGMIELALQEGGSRFDINQLEAKRAGLRLYPQMLRLARRILE